MQTSYAKSFITAAKWFQIVSYTLEYFFNDICYGVMQFGPSLCKEKMLGLVRGATWNGFIELNRMAFSDALPRNSESRCLGIALRLIKKEYPHIKWIVSFADATQCGDGTIYRAAGFLLTGIKKNTGMFRNVKTGEVMQVLQMYHLMIKKDKNLWKPLPGYMMRYIYFLDKEFEKNLNVKVIPYSQIKTLGVSMYRGKSNCLTKCAKSIDIDATTNQVVESGESPTFALQSNVIE
jgi:hypothetical protein